jgi:hypothetical protein
MNGYNKKSRELVLYFTPIYNVLIQNWFLDPTEKLLVSLFASSPNGECTLSREILKKHCRCGHYHLERAIKRLEFMAIISIELGGWKQKFPPLRESNRYIFDPDPYNWRVPKEVQEKIIEETKALKKEPRPFVNGGFPNQLGMDIVFKKAVPNYAEGRKPRKKKSAENFDAHSQSEPTFNDDDQKWIKKSKNLVADDLRFTYLAREYYRYYDEINFSRENPDHGFSEHQLTYFERLYALFSENKRKLRNQDDIDVFNKIAEWLNENKSNSYISHELGRLDKMRKEGL